MPGDGAVEQVARRACAARLRTGSPKRSESSTAIGRAPIAKMSRRMPADAGRRALEGLDRARVVVRLDLEGAHQAAADVDRAGVLAGAHHHVRALGRQRAQQLLGVLVGAVLAPQQREHRELDLIRLARPASRRSARTPRASGRARARPATVAAACALSDTRALDRQAHRLEDRQPVGRARQLVDRVLGVGHQPEHVAAPRCARPRCRAASR